MQQNDRFNADWLVNETRYAETMHDTVLPFLQERENKFIMEGYEGKPIACYRYDAESPRGTVVIVHGFTECAAKFSELIFSLLHNGQSVLALDQRGHGASWRDEGLKGDLTLTHVTHFDEYVRDLELLCDGALRDMPKPWRVFAHSMGGAVTCRLLEKRQDIFDAAALCAPMIAPQRGGVPLRTAKALCRTARVFGGAKRRIFLSKPYHGPEDFETSCATSRERFDWYDALRVATPQYQNNGPTYTWTLEAVRVTSALMKKGEPEKIACPVRLWTAESDNQVIPEAQEAFIARVRDGQRRVVQGAKHEIYRSTDAVLFPWWREVLQTLTR